ncbi:hypothetical protein DFH27DRAFT_157915 [Peziza echinospora]|nr:hypothetical protein DFH27DRAFT_157915 [Peziza echinospora]
MFLPMLMTDQTNTRVDAGDRFNQYRCRPGHKDSGLFLIVPAHSTASNRSLGSGYSVDNRPRTTYQPSSKYIDALSTRSGVRSTRCPDSHRPSTPTIPTTSTSKIQDKQVRDLNSERRNNDNGRKMEEFFTYNRSVVFGGCDWEENEKALKGIRRQLSDFECRKGQPGVHARVRVDDASSMGPPPFDAIFDLQTHLASFLSMIGPNLVEVDAKNPSKPLCQDKLAWSDFTTLAYLMKRMAYINDSEFPQNVDGKTGKFILTGNPLGPSSHGMEFVPSFKPMGTIQLNRALLLRLRTITGPIQVQGKYPIKEFDGKSRKDKSVAESEFRHKLQVSETDFETFMKSSRLCEQWNSKSAEKQRHICKQMIDSLTLLFLYWAYYLHKERRLHLDGDSERVKRAFKDLLSQRVSAYLEKDPDVTKALPFNDVDVTERQSRSTERHVSPEPKLSVYTSSNGSYIDVASSSSRSTDRHRRYIGDRGSSTAAYY